MMMPIHKKERTMLFGLPMKMKQTSIILLMQREIGKNGAKKISMLHICILPEVDI